MGKLLDSLNRQLNTENKKSAEKCMKIYNELTKLTGSVWSSDWQVLTDSVYQGFNKDRIYIPSKIGEIFLKGLDN